MIRALMLMLFIMIGQVDDDVLVLVDDVPITVSQYQERVLAERIINERLIDFQLAGANDRFEAFNELYMSDPDFALLIDRTYDTVIMGEYVYQQMILDVELQMLASRLGVEPDIEAAYVQVFGDEAETIRAALYEEAEQAAIDAHFYSIALHNALNEAISKLPDDWQESFEITPLQDWVEVVPVLPGYHNIIPGEQV